MDNYTLWTKHGEPVVLMESDEDDDDDNNNPDLAHLYEVGAFDDEPMDEAKENAAEELPHDELGQVLLDAQKDSEIMKDSKKFEKMLEDHKKLLDPDCKQGHKKLGSTLELLQWKAANGVTDKDFEELLGIRKNMLPEDNELPSSTYEAKRLFDLLDWRYRRFAHVLMTVSSITAMNMRIWMLVLFVMQSGIRSGKMILVMSKKFLLKLCGISL
jgi:hypothetical protein